MISLMLSFFLLTSLAHAADYSLPLPEREVLSNGLEVVWFLDDKLPLVDFALVVKSGSVDDPAGKSGTAELLAQTLDRGNDGQTASEIRKSAEMLGASRYINAEENLITVGIHGLAIDSPSLLELLGKISLKPEFPDNEISKQHSKIADQWKHVSDYGDLLVNLAHVRMITAGSPYARGPLLSLKEFNRVTRNDIVSFHQKHLTPKNSILVIVGRVNKVEFGKSIQRIFGSWTGEAPQHDPVKYTDPRLRTQPGTIVLIDKPKLGQAQVRIGFRGPSIYSPDRHALAVANALLGEYFSSRLNSLIRDKLGLTYAISSGISYNKEMSIFTVSSSTRNETAGQLIKKVIGVLEGLKESPVSDEEVTTSKDYLIGGFPLGTSTLSAVAARWIGGYLQGLGPNYLNDYISQIRSVTKEDVQKAILKNFDLKNLVVTVAGDAKEVERSLNEQSPRPKIKKLSYTFAIQEPSK